MSSFDFNSEEWQECLEKARRNHEDEINTAVQMALEKLHSRILAEATANGISEYRMLEKIIGMIDLICEMAFQRFNAEISPRFANKLYSLSVKQLQRINYQIFSLQTIEQLESLIDEVAQEQPLITYHEFR